MALRADSYGTAAEVTAFTRHLLHGQSAFNSTTRPTVTELEKFIDRASGALNVALEREGLSTPITNTTAKLLCDDWVTMQSSMYVEMTQRGVGFGSEEGSRVTYFKGLYTRANEFAKENRLGMLRLGVTVQNKSSDGLQFTGLGVQADRVDPDDTSLEQPTFKRRQFDDVSADE